MKIHIEIHMYVGFRRMNVCVLVYMRIYLSIQSINYIFEKIYFHFNSLKKPHN
jgi:hypothetical protein